jgi:mRNA interferase RelE/StbE
MYEVKFTPDADADLARLDKPIAQQVLKKVKWLAEHFDDITPEPLAGEWQRVFKLRVGDYRALYTFDRTGRKITVHYVKHRREVYRTK